MKSGYAAGNPLKSGIDVAMGAVHRSPRFMLVDFIKTSCVALALVLALPLRAEQQKSPPPAIGATREQLVARFGEPKSQLQAGTREVLFFPHWKLTLRNDAVIEVEELADDPPPRRAPAAEAPAAAPAAPAATPNADQPAPPSAAPDAPDPGAVGPKPAAPAVPAVAEVAPTLEIKSIRRTPAPKGGRKTAPAATPSAAPKSTVIAATNPAKPAEPTSKAKPPSAPPQIAQTATSPGQPAATTDIAEAAAPEASTAGGEPTETEAAPKPVASPASKLLFVRRRADLVEPEFSVVSTQTYVLAMFVVGCAAYLYWRRSQRVSMLAATTVSNTPFDAPVVDTGAMFTAELLARLDAGRFERLVAAYYSKTGVVAESTHSAPDAPVHIKIFWKGEPKPFAGVQCHARPTGLIGVQPLQDLFANLSAAEIRRGYVVTTGKFNVDARDFAEEKHFTLLPGDLFLEKLNALPAPARADLLKETSAEPAVSAERTIG